MSEGEVHLSSQGPGGLLPDGGLRDPEVTQQEAQLGEAAGEAAVVGGEEGGPQGGGEAGAGGQEQVGQVT